MRKLRARIPHRFAAYRGLPGCGRCGVPADAHPLPLRCRLGLHDDGSDAFGGYSTVCLRCYRPV